MKSMIYASLALAVVYGSAAAPLMRNKPMHGDVERIAVSSEGDAKIMRKRSGEMPQDCVEFKEKCAAKLLKDYPVANEQEAKGGFELCCVGAGHKNSTCTSISGELFDHDPESMPSEEQCKELTELSLAHDHWKGDHHSQSSLLEATSTARAELVVKRMAELEAIMPRQIQMLAALSAAAVAGVAVGGPSLIAGVASVGHVAISAVAAGLALRLQGCEEGATPNQSPGLSVCDTSTSRQSTCEMPSGVPACHDAQGGGVGGDGRGGYDWQSYTSTQCEYYKNKNECGLWGDPGCKKTCNICQASSSSSSTSSSSPLQVIPLAYAQPKSSVPVGSAGRLYTTASGALTAKIVASSLASAAMPGNCDVVWCV